MIDETFDWFADTAERLIEQNPPPMGWVFAILLRVVQGVLMFTVAILALAMVVVIVVLAVAVAVGLLRWFGVFGET